MTKFCTFLEPEVEAGYIALALTNGKKLLVLDGQIILQFIPEKQAVISKQSKKFKIGELAIFTEAPGQSTTLRLFI